MMTRQQMREIVFRHTFYHVADQITDAIYPEMEAMQKRIDELEAAALEAAAYPPNSSEDKPPARPMTVSEDGPSNPIDYALYALSEIFKRTAPIGIGYDTGNPPVAALALEARKRLQGHVERLKAETLASGPGKGKVILPKGTPMARNAQGRCYPCQKDDPAKIGELLHHFREGEPFPYVDMITSGGGSVPMALAVDDAAEITRRAWDEIKTGRGIPGRWVTHAAATPSTPADGQTLHEKFIEPIIQQRHAEVDHDPAIGAHPENFRGTDGYENIT